MPGFLSSRPNWVPPLHRPHWSIAPPPFGSKGGGTQSLTGEEVQGPVSDEGTDTLILYVHYNSSSDEVHLFRHSLIFMEQRWKVYKNSVTFNNTIRKAWLHPN